MTNCNKYVVVEMNKACLAEELQNWFNELYEKYRYELVAIDGVNYIFKRNAYMISIEKTSENKCECS